jgi:hypothetical protein
MPCSTKLRPLARFPEMQHCLSTKGGPLNRSADLHERATSVVSLLHQLAQRHQLKAPLLQSRDNLIQRLDFMRAVDMH